VNDAAQPQTPQPGAPRGLWMLVIGLGIAILLVLAAMIGMAIKQAVYDPKPAPAATASVTPGEVPELNLDLAPGTTIAESRMDGATLVVRLTGPNGDEVILIDPVKSKVLSRVRFNKKAP
jgi:hypothetical protein